MFGLVCDRDPLRMAKESPKFLGGKPIATAARCYGREQERDLYESSYNSRCTIQRDMLWQTQHD